MATGGGVKLLLDNELRTDRVNLPVAELYLRGCFR
jgi:hypothetical protein